MCGYMYTRAASTMTLHAKRTTIQHTILFLALPEQSVVAEIAAGVAVVAP